MKTLFLTAMAGALLFTGGFAGTGSVDATDQMKGQSYVHDQINDGDNLQQFTEYEVLEAYIDDVEDYNVQVVEDNAEKRVLVLTDNNQQYKSIFIKNTNRLKVIDLDKGPILNQVITPTDEPEADDDNELEEENESAVDVDDFYEFDTLEAQIDANDDHARIVEDNQQKRVMFVNSEDSQKQYKSIFIKDTNRLKIVDLNNSEVFNQVITNTDKPEADDDDNESEEENESAVDVDDFYEFDTLEAQIDADDDHACIVEDNQHKRVMFVNSEDSQKQYKSIFIKDTNRLKIVDLNNGEVFNQIIK
ncbi:hypothetical protein BN1058_00139 [Paraliobacillus sp. PM-2]|uniref:hypothetical protein n=1 Tax=Paraliobacillus sp. PM-2 TaxID=1462524 RepID=UPI00061C4736|nr:hypothetical protein [Paraliobacillus sp. PM-2]CQR45898.1 hypothetical protein BN1058_00139 [Paraliobacillus sp. PM-2]